MIGEDGSATLRVSIHEAQIDQLESSNIVSNLKQARFPATINLDTPDTLNDDLRRECHGHTADLEFKLRLEGSFAELQCAVLEPMEDARVHEVGHILSGGSSSRVPRSQSFTFCAIAIRVYAIAHFFRVGMDPRIGVITVSYTHLTLPTKA